MTYDSRLGFHAHTNEVFATKYQTSLNINYKTKTNSQFKLDSIKVPR